LSYCRWSSDDFLCDLYCYESAQGFITYVANTRPVYLEALPPEIPLREDTLKSYMERWDKVMDMHHAAEKVPIGLPMDGKDFCDKTLSDFLQTLKMLKGMGYRFPDSVIEAVEEEMRAGGEKHAR
jgi:hypothetical protein